MIVDELAICFPNTLSYNLPFFELSRKTVLHIVCSFLNVFSLQNGQKSEVNGDTYSSRNLSSLTARVFVPRHNIPPVSYSSADSFDQFSLAASNPTSTRTQPRNPEIEQENLDANVKRTNYSQVPVTRSETSPSSSSSDDTESEEYNRGRTSQPPIPY